MAGNTQTTDEPDDSQSNQQPDESNADGQEERAEAEVVEPTDIEPAEEVEALSTFSEREGAFNYKVLPEISRTGSDWKVLVYMEGVQGPVYQSTSAISDEAADRLGMSRRLQHRINEALEYADANLEIPPELGNQERQKRSLHELEVMMEEATMEEEPEVVTEEER